MTTKKFYIAENREYLEMLRSKSWEDAFDGKGERSELQKPYLANNEDDDTYQMWEWEWPDPEPLPDLPPIPGGADPVPHECNIDENCEWAKVFGDTTAECGTSEIYFQMHFWRGCSLPPYWAAFGGWYLDAAEGGGVEITSQSAVMATVYIDATASTQQFTICYAGPLDCQDCLDVTVECGECCADFTLTGNATVDPGATWTGTIDPACPGAECFVSSNSGCSLECDVNAAGSQVTVTVGASDCGSFTVTVRDTVKDGECYANQDSYTVMINNTGQGGEYISCGSNTWNGSCSYIGCACTEYSGIYEAIWDEGSGATCGLCAQNFVCGDSTIAEWCPAGCVACDPFLKTKRVSISYWGCEC